MSSRKKGEEGRRYVMITKDVIAFNVENKANISYAELEITSKFFAPFASWRI